MSFAKNRILFEDEWLLVVNKLGGELSVQGKGRLDKLPLFDFLKKDYPGLHVVHRLDFETSGVIVFAKSAAVLRAILDSKFGGWKKTYEALVFGVPKHASGDIAFPLPARNTDDVVDSMTHYRVLDAFRDLSLVECTIERGQKHQIRRHLSMLGHPLILDDLYGKPKVNHSFGKFFKMQRFFLHARSIHFPHPITHDSISLTAPLPPVFDRVLKALRSVR
jgi:23S rRNA pseudouridine1911/1915/1917 synthase